MRDKPVLDIKLITNTQDLPSELKPKIDSTTPSSTYLLYLDTKLIGWGQVLFHNQHEHEIAYVEIISKHREKGYGKKLVQFMVYNCPSQKLMLTTVTPEFFMKLGFHKMPNTPSFVDYSDPQCQVCSPDKCNILYFEKPEYMIRFGSNKDYQDRCWQLMHESRPMASEYSCANNLMWSFSENPYFIEVDNMLFMAGFPFDAENYGAVFTYKNIPAKTLKKYINILKSIGISRIKYQTIYNLNNFKTFKHINIIEDRDYFDYLYKTRDLAEYAGKKYEKKRNRRKKFLKNYPEYQIVPYHPRHNRELIGFARQIASGPLNLPGMYSYNIIEYGLNENLLEGFFVKVNEIIVGLLLYSELNPKTAVVHFELMHPEYDGVSQLLNNHLGKTLINRYKFINREQDLGIPGLRRSKLSYRPYRLLKKYTVLLD
ncbi:MAG: GNAT family N-acetyltransferase [Candidatus Margulisiibacteriota bacterium]